jgi:hypothetical protein
MEVTLLRRNEIRIKNPIFLTLYLGTVPSFVLIATVRPKTTIRKATTREIALKSTLLLFGSTSSTHIAGWG